MLEHLFSAKYRILLELPRTFLLIVMQIYYYYFGAKFSYVLTN